MALDSLDEMPSGNIFIIPIRLDDCEVPSNFNDIHYCDLFEENGFDLIFKAIKSQISLQKVAQYPDLNKHKSSSHQKSFNQNKLYSLPESIGMHYPISSSSIKKSKF